jgi:hypothetical protein
MSAKIYTYRRGASNTRSPEPSGPNAMAFEAGTGAPANAKLCMAAYMARRTSAPWRSPWMMMLFIPGTRSWMVRSSHP